MRRVPRWGMIPRGLVSSCWVGTGLVLPVLAVDSSFVQPVTMVFLGGTSPLVKGFGVVDVDTGICKGSGESLCKEPLHGQFVGVHPSSVAKEFK
jgi:hypothetical protein